MVHSDYHCTSHLPSVSNHSSFMKEVKTIISKNDDKDSYLLKIGSYCHNKTGIITSLRVPMLSECSYFFYVRVLTRVDGSRNRDIE